MDSLNYMSAITSSTSVLLQAGSITGNSVNSNAGAASNANGANGSAATSSNVCGSASTLNVSSGLQYSSSTNLNSYCTFFATGLGGYHSLAATTTTNSYYSCVYGAAGNPSCAASFLINDRKRKLSPAAITFALNDDEIGEDHKFLLRNLNKK